MTQRGHKNHYNVKLRGYGVSISLKDSKIILKNGRYDVIGKQEYESWFRVDVINGIVKIPAISDFRIF